MHSSDHAALGRHIRPVNHLLSVVKVQGDGVVQALDMGGSGRRRTTGSGHRWLEKSARVTNTGPVGRMRGLRGAEGAARGRGRSSGPGETGGAGWHLFEQRVVGAVQVELAQIVAVGEDQERLLICTQNILAQLPAGARASTPGPQLPEPSDALQAPGSPVTALQLWGSPPRGA